MDIDLSSPFCAFNSSPYALRVLRTVSLASFPPAFVLSLVHGILSHKNLPALALIPLFASCLLGASVLLRLRITFGGSSLSANGATLFVCLSDLVLGVTLLALFIVSCKTVVDRTIDPTTVMWGSWATVPILMNS